MGNTGFQKKEKNMQNYAHIGDMCFLTNILQRSERFTEKSFAMENKFLPKTVLRSFLHKLERNLMQSLDLASIVS